MIERILRQLKLLAANEAFLFTTEDRHYIEVLGLVELNNRLSDALVRWMRELGWQKRAVRDLVLEVTDGQIIIEKLFGITNEQEEKI